MKTARVVVGSVLGCAVILWLAGNTMQLAGWWFNASASAPVGLWQVVRAQRPLPRHAWVLVCPSPQSLPFTTAKARGTIPPGPCPGGFAPLIKQLAAVPGDTVQLTRHGMHVNGQLLPNTRPLLTDGQGRPMPTLIVPTHPVGPNDVWLVSGKSRARGFDSRYFGPLPRRQVLGTARLVWAWGDSNTPLPATPRR